MLENYERQLIQESFNNVADDIKVIDIVLKKLNKKVNIANFRSKLAIFIACGAAYLAISDHKNLTKSEIKNGKNTKNVVENDDFEDDDL